MNNDYGFYLNEIEKNEMGASDGVIAMVQNQLDFLLPKDYIDLMREFDGGEGGVGESSWICFFPIEDLVSINSSYHILLEQIPDYFLFGKDAADTGYAFHKQNQSVHSFGLMSNFETDAIEFCGKNLIDFLEFLYRQL